MESLPTTLRSLLVSRGSSHEPIAFPSCLRQLSELVVRVSYWDVHDDTISSFRDVMANNTNTLRRLSLSPDMYARLPVRLFDNLTHLHMMDYDPYSSGAELDLNFALRHTTRLESLSLPMHRERETIASLYDNGNALANLVSLQLCFHYQLPPPDEDRLLDFLRERRRLRRLYLQFGKSSNPFDCRNIFLLLKELQNLQVLGLNPCHLMLPDTGVLQYSTADFLPPKLKAFHAILPDLPFSYDNLTLLHGLGNFNRLTYLDLVLADPYRHPPFKPAEFAADNLQLRLLGLDDDVYDVRAGIPVSKWPAWKRILALPEDFEDEDHWWLHTIAQAWRGKGISLPMEYYSHSLSEGSVTAVAVSLLSTIRLALSGRMPTTGPKLYPELWTKTFRILDCRDWMRLRHVCHTFNAIVSPLLFSSLRIFIVDSREKFGVSLFPSLPAGVSTRDSLEREKYNHAKAERFSIKSWEILDHITRNPTFASLVRSMNVYAFCSSSAIFECLCIANALRKLPRLRTFRWFSDWLQLPPVVAESLTPDLSSLISYSKPRSGTSLAHLRHLREIVVHVNSWGFVDDSIREVLSINSGSLRMLTLPSNFICESLPARLFDNLTHLHILCDPDSTQLSPALGSILNGARSLESLSLQPNSIYREGEIIKSLFRNADTLMNLVSLRLHLSHEIDSSPSIIPDLIGFISKQRNLRRLYLESGQLNNPTYSRLIFSLIRELPHLCVLGLNPCHILVPDAIRTPRSAPLQLVDFLPRNLKALHAELPNTTRTFFEYNQTVVNRLGELKHLTYVNLLDYDYLLLFVPSQIVADNPQLQFIGHNGRLWDFQPDSSNVEELVERPQWMSYYAPPEDFVDEDHMWLYDGYVSSNTIVYA
ncbi:hypothetical protein AX14_001553 [Amanita brunnescens Koide BX004]|nr:hypothetical protein AX14_001553 [Amanita brunnescens Koide BX004]